MPELPEVETIVRDLLNAGVVGCTITGSRVSWARTIQGMSPQRFDACIRGRRILDVQRRAKYIVAPISSRQWLLIHLRMTGRIHVALAGTARADHERAALILGDGRELRFIDTRKFGRWALVDDVAATLGKLGPEPLAPDFKAGHLQAILRAHHRMLKPLLLDQHMLAGLGNIYVDEALWEARLNPCRAGDTLSDAEARRLYRAIREVLGRAIRSMGTSLGTGKGNFYSVAGGRGRNQDGLRVFRRHGEPCPRCAARIERRIVAQRSTHVCPACQPGTPLA